MYTLPSYQRGATLIEVLITLLLVAIGLLGAAGLQLASTRYQQTSAMRTQALHQADFIIEKMRVNNTTLTLANLATAAANPDGAYLAANAYAAAAVLPADPACGLNAQPACTPAQAAQRDLREWRESLARELPGGRGSIFPVEAAGVTEPNARRVVVMWREKPELETDNDAALGIASREDDTCPAPRVDGVRCLNLWVTP
ncbi:type IV pilus modification protein PilV [Hydrogenophaga sp.]|uniref:type IV pilus modification protein PilV n=1 Tax=Hydrogenophaga sp. TaxID=1904254 RepID=UPI00271D5065|nr:type IV pilus modification protein PilV [Hydrogenophaga sp.]MDO8903744.1 type IV pilus modification protein PilV [Hydrogenophaga sp.]